MTPTTALPKGTTVTLPGGCWFPIKSLHDASIAIQAVSMIPDSVASGNNFYLTKNVGVVKNGLGEPIARISPNGRIWDVDGKTEILPEAKKTKKSALAPVYRRHDQR